MNTEGYNYHSTIIHFDDTDYLVQGNINDDILMFRDINELLESERDNVNVMLGGRENYD